MPTPLTGGCGGWAWAKIFAKDNLRQQLQQNQQNLLLQIQLLMMTTRQGCGASLKPLVHFWSGSFPYFDRFKDESIKLKAAFQCDAKHMQGGFEMSVCSRLSLSGCYGLWGCLWARGKLGVKKEACWSLSGRPQLSALAFWSIFFRIVSSMLNPNFRGIRSLPSFSLSLSLFPIMRKELSMEYIYISHAYMHKYLYILKYIHKFHTSFFSLSRLSLILHQLVCEDATAAVLWRLWRLFVGCGGCAGTALQWQWGQFRVNALKGQPQLSALAFWEQKMCLGRFVFLPQPFLHTDT